MMMKSVFCFDFSEAAVYTETLGPTPGLWATRILILSPGSPTGYAADVSILYAVSHFHLSDCSFGMVETPETKNSWSPVQGKLLVGASPLAFQLNL